MLDFFFNFLINFESSDFPLLDVSPSSKVVKPSMSCVGSMEYSGFSSLDGILSFSGSESESEYRKFRMFALFIVDCSIFVLKSNLFLALLAFELDPASYASLGERDPLLFELL